MQTSERPAGTVFSGHMPKARPGTPWTRELPLALLLEPLDPMRHSMDDEEMLRLQNDIREHGLYENLCVVPVMPNSASDWQRVQIQDVDGHIAAGGRFRVAAGHRRLLACRAVQYDPVKCEIFHDLTVNEETIMHGENAHREDPSDFDLAVLYAKWIQEPGMTEAELCKRAGKSPEFIYARAELLQGYKEVADALHERQIKFAVARALNRCDEPEFMLHFLRMAIDQGATAKLVSAWVNERKAFKDMSSPAPPQGAQPLRPAVQAFQKVECLICGDTQSYNLQTVLLCGGDIERIKILRANAEASEEAGGDVQANSGENGK